MGFILTFITLTILIACHLLVEMYRITIFKTIKNIVVSTVLGFLLTMLISCIIYFFFVEDSTDVTKIDSKIYSVKIAYDEGYYLVANDRCYELLVCKDNTCEKEDFLVSSTVVITDDVDSAYIEENVYETNSDFIKWYLADLGTVHRYKLHVPKDITIIND